MPITLRVMLKTIRMNRYRAFKCAAAAFAMLLGLAAVGCGKSQKTIVVGSMSSTEQVVLGEIVAQHLEHRLGRKVDRRLDLGGRRWRIRRSRAAKSVCMRSTRGRL